MRRLLTFVVVAVAIVLLDVRIQFGSAGIASFGAGGIGGVFSNQAGSDQVLSVVNYGAKGDCSTDDTTAIQSAIEAAVTGGSSGEGSIVGQVYLPGTPNSCYKTTFPLWVHGGSTSGSRIKLKGPGKENALISAGGNYPVLFVAPKTWTSGLNCGLGAGTLWTTPLAGATGQSMCFDPTNAAWYLDAKSPFTSPVIPYNGQSGFAVEFWADITDTTNGHIGNFVYGGGNDGTQTTTAGVTGVVQLSYTIASAGAANTIAINLNLSSGVKTCGQATGTFTSNAVHFISLDYDGAHCWWSLDGTFEAGQAATGTTVDNANTPLNIGAMSQFPLAASGQPKGQMFGLRISKVARHTYNTNYTAPSSALSGDSNTMLLVNGTNVNSAISTSSASGPFVQPEYVNGVANSTAWMPMLNLAALVNQKADVEGLSTKNGSYSLLTGLTLDSTFRDLFLWSANYVGFYALNNTYGDAVRDVRISTASANAWAAFALLWPSMACDHCTVDSGAGIYAMLDQCGNNYISPFFQMNSNTAAGIVSTCNISSEWGHIDAMTADNENGSTGPILIINGGGGFLTVSNSSMVSGSGVAPVYLNASASAANVVFQNDAFGNVGSPTAWVLANSATASGNNQRVTFIGDTFGSTTASLEANSIPLASAGITYDASQSSIVQTITGTTAGKALWSTPQFTSGRKTVVVQLAAYENTTGTAQTATLPVGIGTVGSVVTDSGSCTGVTISASTLTLPSSMGATQTGQCEVVGY